MPVQLMYSSSSLFRIFTAAIFIFYANQKVASGVMVITNSAEAVPPAITNCIVTVGTKADSS